MIERYFCDALEDVATLYSTFDSKMQSRASEEIYLSFAGTVRELECVNRRIITASIVGMAYHKLGADMYASSQPSERAELVMEYTPFVVWLNGLLSEGGIREAKKISHTRNSHLTRQGVTAAMFASFEKSASAATEFWCSVRDETGSDPGLPSRRLSRYLMLIAARGSEGRHLGRIAVRETYVKCLHAWNAWRKGESTNLNYHVDKPVPEAR